MDIGNLKYLIDAYGVAVRAGVITPQMEDEKSVRELFSLPAMSPNVVNLWNESNGVKRPITLQQETAPAVQPAQEGPDNE